MEPNNQTTGTSAAPDDIVHVSGAPDVPGLIYRRFRGPDDYPAIAALIQAAAVADGIDSATTPDDVANNYAHLTNSDPARDMIMAEVDGELVSYWRGEWRDEPGGPLVYFVVGYVAPMWRALDIDRAALRWLENRLRDVAAGHDPARPKFFQYFQGKLDDYSGRLMASEGYSIVRYGQEMVRPTLDDIPDFPLPDGLEVRPVKPEHLRAIWDADVEAFRDHWGFSEPTEEDYQAWVDNKVTFQPELWQIAWDTVTDEVAGQVKAFINHTENEKFGRKRGYTEFISTRRPYRRRGLARALIVRSLRLQRDTGMTESALGADSDNPTGAIRVYEDCGFVVARRTAVYRKAL